MALRDPTDRSWPRRRGPPDPGGTSPATAEAVEVGQKAPNFDLAATTGGKISLAQLRGNRYC